MNLKEKKVAFFSAALLIIAALFSTGFHQIDEHFQILEFAALKLGLTTASELPWEYHECLRPAFQPLIVVWVYQFFASLGAGNPFLVSTVLRIISAVISWVSMCLIYQYGKARFSREHLRNWFLLLSFFSWFLFYNHVRFSSENWSGAFFLIGFTIFFASDRTLQKRCFISGLMMGFAFICRYQSAFLILGFLGWLILVRKVKHPEITLFISGIVMVCLMGVLLDRWFYGKWALTTWNYFQQNILRDRISHFGVDPWWFYLKKGFEQLLPPFSLAFITSILWYLIKNPKDPITWIFVPFVAVHFLISHKEMRFLYPLVGFFPLILVTFLSFIENKKPFHGNQILPRVLMLYWIVNLGCLVFVIFRPAGGNIELYRTIYGRYSRPVTLYFLAQNPYHQVYNFHFYSRPNLVVRPFDDISGSTNATNSIRLIARGLKETLPVTKEKLTLIYSTYPEWLYPFHQKGWLGLGNAYFIYEFQN